MPESEKDNSGDQQQVVVLAVVVAGALTVAMAEGAYTFLDSVVGVALLFVLYAYGTETDANNQLQSATFATVFALCITLIVSAPIELITGTIAEKRMDAILALTWLLVAGVVYGRRRNRFGDPEPLAFLKHVLRRMLH